LLDAIYLRLKIDSEHIPRVSCLTEKQNNTVLLSNLGNLTKSKSQQTFIEKYLTAHLRFIEAAKMAGGRSILEGMEEKLSFLDLLRIQMAP